MAKNSDDSVTTEYTGTPLDLYDSEPAWVVNWPRTLTHHHTYGQLTPFFKGLTQGKLLATRCSNPNCLEKSTFLPPRADCPDCYAKTEWIEAPTEGRIYTFTRVDYAGIGIEMKTPYWQIDIEIKGIDTIFKGYLLSGKPEIGMKVKAQFRTENPTHTILDIYWIPAE
ncbi:MAG: Zn-ribbon domain-containing OB-fold protein [Deltaproteobacteria bacterium]|nr:Zn-ribbon domain-containing OB-fold protein [Deltaproteobacteria bacterium]MBW2086728.1 Zn-ribbon domain-containing OB-fold protein [Deltaproteobacteria bacterium]